MLMFVWLFLAVLCLLYGLIVRMVGSGTTFFVVWILLGGFFLFLAYAVKIRLWSGLYFGVRIAFVTLVAVFAANFICAEWRILSAFHEEGRENLDCIIVLGAQVYEDGPSVVLKYRLDKAIEYLNSNPSAICIVSGGQGYNEPDTEAAVMANYMKMHGIPLRRILLESKSTTTAENIRNSRQLIPTGASVGVITNNFHLYRALQIAKEQGLEEVSGIAARSTPLYLPNNMIREFFALVKFRLSGS